MTTVDLLVLLDLCVQALELLWPLHQVPCLCELSLSVHFMLVLICRDAGDTTSKVSCCVEPS